MSGEWVDRALTVLSECRNDNQILDSDNERYIRQNVLGVPITVTSARPRQSEYRSEVFAQIGFSSPSGVGQFSIGGNAAWLPLRLQRFNQLPKLLILRATIVKNGRQLYKWEVPNVDLARR